MSTSALSGVIDYLMAQFPAVAVAIDPAASVQEGYLADSTNTIVGVAMDHPSSPLGMIGTRNYFELGAGRVNEDFVVPCFIDCWTGDVDQSVIRRRACLIFDAITDLIRSDLTLGGALKNGRWAEITDMTLSATQDLTEGAKGRRAVLTFRIHCRNYY